MISELIAWIIGYDAGRRDSTSGSGKKIWINVTERGRNGGKARAASMSKAALSDAARKAVNKRWDRVRALAAAKQAKAAKRKAGRGKAAA